MYDWLKKHVLSEKRARVDDSFFWSFFKYPVKSTYQHGNEKQEAYKTICMVLKTTRFPF